MAMRVRFCALALALWALTSFSFCSSTTSSTPTPASSGFVVDQSAAGSALVTPASGGVVRTRNGDTLTVPPGAVTEATTITMAPLVFPTTGRTDVFGGVVTTPERLEFLVAARLTLALSQPLEPGVELELAESHDPGVPISFGSANVLYVVDAGGNTATGAVQGFTGKVVEKNCHAGTRDNVLNAWGGRPGRDDASIGRMTGVNMAEFRSCIRPGPDPLQEMIAPYFKQCADILPGQPFDDATRDKIAISLAAGRQVVFLFGGAMPINPATGLRRSVDHSAVAIPKSDGSISIRNQLNITDKDTITLLEKLGKGSTLDLPLADIDKVGGMRDLRKGETTAILKNEAFDRTIRGPAWPHVIVMCETFAEPDAGAPDTGVPDTGAPDTGAPDTGAPDTGAPDTGASVLRIKVITTSSDDPNEPIATPLDGAVVLIGPSVAAAPPNDDVGRTTVPPGTHVVKYPKANGLDDAAGNHLFKVGSINVSPTNGSSPGKRCAPVSQEGDLPVKFNPLAPNPDSQSDYEVGIRIVRFDAPPLAKAENCN
jgi:hypothetical protein